MSDYILNENEALRKEIEKLRAENAELKSMMKLINSEVLKSVSGELDLIIYITKLTKQNEIMKKALEFYGDRDNWQEPDNHVMMWTLWDDGDNIGFHVAEKALHESEGVEKTTITGAIIHGAGYVETKPVKIEHGSPPLGKITIEED